MITKKHIHKQSNTKNGVMLNIKSFRKQFKNWWLDVSTNGLAIAPEYYRTLSFVNHFLKHTESYESPTSFFRWAAYTAIAATLRDNCYRRLGDTKLYPNLYTLLLADSAVHRKGQPVKLCEKLTQDTKITKVISGRSSIQGILDELAKGETDKISGKLLSGGSALFSAPELSAGIVNDPEAVKILTDIYDFKDEYTSRLRGSGIFRIKNVCITMFAASNDELLRDVYDSKAMFGGLLGRTFLIKPDNFRPGNSLFAIRDTSASYKILLEKLIEISKLSGEFEFTAPAIEAYESWYIPFRDSYKLKSDKSGISGRIHTSVLKLAMVLCVDRTQKLIVDETHICDAIKECVALLPNYTGLVMSSGRATDSDIAAAIIEDIWTSRGKKLTKTEFLSSHFHQYDLDSIDKCVMKLVQAELIREGLDSGSKSVFWTVTEKCEKIFNLKTGEEK